MDSGQVGKSNTVYVLNSTPTAQISLVFGGCVVFASTGISYLIGNQLRLLEKRSTQTS